MTIFQLIDVPPATLTVVTRVDLLSMQSQAALRLAIDTAAWDGTLLGALRSKGFAAVERVAVGAVQVASGGPVALKRLGSTLHEPIK